MAATVLAGGFPLTLPLNGRLKSKTRRPATKDGGVAVNKAEYGAGRPIVFIHGWRLSGDLEAQEIEPVFASQPGWRRIYVTLPGMGEADSDPSIEDMDGYLEWLVGFVERELPSGAFAIAGTSAGAGLARAVADLHKERIRGVFLRVPMLESGSRPVFESDRQRDDHLDDPASDVPMPAAFGAEVREEIERRWRPTRALATRPEVVAIRNDPDRYRLKTRIEGVITAPSLVVAGRQDGRVRPGFADASSALTELPRATVAILDRAAHVLPLRDRALFDALVHDWLRRMAEVWDEGSPPEPP